MPEALTKEEQVARRRSPEPESESELSVTAVFKLHLSLSKKPYDRMAKLSNRRPPSLPWGRTGIDYT